MATYASTYEPRSFFGARLEPRDTVLHGGGQDPEAFRAYIEALGAGRSPIIFMTYIGVKASPEGMGAWGQRLRGALAGAGPDCVMPQIGLNMTGGKDTGHALDAEVAAGRYDAEIDAFCDQLENLGRPVFIRIGYEFEGPWNGYQPESYKASFIRVAQALRSRKINCATVWCSAGNSFKKQSLENSLRYYPGDEWVDWWGIDIFSADECLSPKTIEFCEAAAARRKPVMIGESTPRQVGVLDGAVSWDKWFAPYFTLIRSQPNIKAFCYINWEWREISEKLGFNWHNWGDCRIQRNAIVLERYQREMDCPLYRHADARSAETE